jgi:endonuclease/exonuclease/phosphatase family metal-dependent hydrolase
MRIATFNVQNLRLRHSSGGARLDGARDADVAEDAGPEAEALDPVDRRLTAAVIREADADVVALQEVFDEDTLDHFHDHVLLPAGVTPYPHRVCRQGNDGRGLDVAVMSRRPFDTVAGHADLRPEDLRLDPPEGFGDQPVFRRDCLMLGIGRLTLLVCHFKAPWPDAAASWPVRRLEAEAVRRILEARFPDPAEALWLIAGDLNDPDAPGSAGRAIAPLEAPFAVDLSLRMPPPERWTCVDPGSGRTFLPDLLLASPRLAAEWPDAAPHALRAGLSREAGPRAGPRLPHVGEHRPHASDHAALVVDLPGL